MNIITATFALVKVDAAIFICKTNDKQNKMRRSVKTKLKTYLAAMAMLFMPFAISAQTDGFFRSDNGGGSRGSYSIEVDSDGSIIHAQTCEGDPDASLGGGLLIMAAAGAGYLLLKKKEEK